MEEELTGSSLGGRKFAVTVTAEGQCKRVLAIDIPEEEVARERDRVTERLRRELKVPGFRKGKVPVAFVKKNYADVIHSDAVRNLLPEVYEEAIEREHLHPLGEPHFDDFQTDEGQGIKATATIEVRPEIEISGYDDVTVEAQRREIGDGDVESTLRDIRERMATLVTVERPAEPSDYMTIDYAPYGESGELDESARQTNYPVELGSENLFEEFRVGLVGKKSGDETDITVKYPDDFPDKDLAGHTRRFNVKVVEVKEKLLPEADDAFATRLNSEVGTIDELKQRIKEDLAHEEAHRFEHDVEEKVIDQLIAHNSFEVPEVMVENYLASVLEEDRRRRPQVPDEAARAGEVRELFHDAAVRSIKKYFIMDAVRKQEGIEVTDADVEARAAKLAEGSGKSVEEIRDYLTHPERRRSFESELMDRKVMEFLRERARVKDPG
jgi:trigger factor